MKVRIKLVSNHLLPIIENLQHSINVENRPGRRTDEEIIRTTNDGRTETVRRPQRGYSVVLSQDEGEKYAVDASHLYYQKDENNEEFKYQTPQHSHAHGQDGGGFIIGGIHPDQTINLEL